MPKEKILIILAVFLQNNISFAESDINNFQSTVNIQGNISQSTSGANNRQDLNVGSASNSRTRSFNANVSTGAIRQSAQGSGIQQRINVGSMQNSQASTFSATVQTRSIEQVATKSGQRQELDIGSVTNSTVNGTVNISVNVGQDIHQIGSGEIVLGSVKNATIGNFNQNLTVQGKLTGNNIRMGSVIGKETTPTTQQTEKNDWPQVYSEDPQQPTPTPIDAKQKSLYKPVTVELKPTLITAGNPSYGKGTISQKSTNPLNNLEHSINLQKAQIKAAILEILKTKTGREIISHIEDIPEKEDDFINNFIEKNNIHFASSSAAATATGFYICAFSKSSINCSDEHAKVGITINPNVPPREVVSVLIHELSHLADIKEGYKISKNTSYKLNFGDTEIKAHAVQYRFLIETKQSNIKPSKLPSLYTESSLQAMKTCYDFMYKSSASRIDAIASLKLGGRYEEKDLKKHAHFNTVTSDF